MIAIVCQPNGEKFRIIGDIQTPALYRCQLPPQPQQQQQHQQQESQPFKRLAPYPVFRYQSAIPFPYPLPRQLPLAYQHVSYWPNTSPSPAPHQERIVVPEPLHPHGNDVLMGRGGKNNEHSGNEKLRKMARDLRDDYIRASKKEKSQISRDLVKKVQAMDPPGRFLLRNRVTAAWEIVDIEYAREKASQCLRDAVAKGSTSGGSDGNDNDCGSSGAITAQSATPVSVNQADRNAITAEGKNPNDEVLDNREETLRDLSSCRLEDTRCPAKVPAPPGRSQCGETLWKTLAPIFEQMGTSDDNTSLTMRDTSVQPFEPIPVDTRYMRRPRVGNIYESSFTATEIDAKHSCKAACQYSMDSEVEKNDDDSSTSSVFGPSTSIHACDKDFDVFGNGLVLEEQKEEDPFLPLEAWPTSKRTRLGTWDHGLPSDSDFSISLDNGSTDHYQNTTLVAMTENKHLDDLVIVNLDHDEDVNCPFNSDFF